MLWTIILILLILWALGGFLALGPLIHILLVIALIVLLVQLISGRRVESLPILQEAIYAMEKRLGLAGEDADTLKKRGRTEIREDAWLGQ